VEEEIRKLQEAKGRVQEEVVAMKAINERYEKLFWNLGTPRPSRRRKIRGKEKR
jgi:hypothetical protein